MSTENENENVNMASGDNDHSDNDHSDRASVMKDIRPRVLEFIDLDNQVKLAKKQIKLLNERKKELDANIRDLMRAYGIDGFSTANGNVHLYVSKTAKAPSKDDVVAVIAEKLGNENLAEEVAELFFAKQNRVPVTTEKIKVIPKRARN